MARNNSSETMASSTDGRENTKHGYRGPVVNRVSLVGRLCADPTLRVTKSDVPVAHLRLATNDRQGTEFHDIVVWRELARIATEHSAKGKLVYVAGRLHGRSWRAQDGSLRHTVEIVADTLQVLDRKPS